MERFWFCHTIVTILVFPSFLSAQTPANQTETSVHGVVATDHPIASKVGAKVLEQGGTAADAGVAALLTLGVVNPFASGLGGGGFCLYKPVDGDVDVLDFRERAPLSATPDLFVTDGKPDILKSLFGGAAVGVPGEAIGLAELHKKFGKLKWKSVVAPSQKLASKGFKVGTLLPKRLASKAKRFKSAPALERVFQRKGKFVQAGDILKRPKLGATLKKLGEKGPDIFRKGPLADAIVTTVNQAGGAFVAEDLSGYKESWRKPLSGTYRGFTIFSMPPPSSGGTTLIGALNILERFDLKTLGQTPSSMHIIAEALKHAFADRARWLGDADFVSVPTEKLIDKNYANTHPVGLSVLPSDAYGTAENSAQLPNDSGTTHVSVVDGAGNMLACTSTINTSFGSLVYVEKHGLLLNNEMADFTAQPGTANNYGLVGSAQNAVEAQKRPLSSMTPTLVLDADGKPFMAAGASGGPTIITGTLMAILRVIDFGLSPGDAVALPRFHHQWLPNVLKTESLPDAWQAQLKRYGHEVAVKPGYNAVQIVVKKDKGWVGASDPRKHGQPKAARK